MSNEWKYRKSERGEGYFVYRMEDGKEKGVTYGGCGCCNEYDDSIDDEKDARLIAAAPELLEALEAFVNYNAEANGDVSITSNDALWIKAESAIAKARGEA